MKSLLLVLLLLTTAASSAPVVVTIPDVPIAQSFLTQPNLRLAAYVLERFSLQLEAGLDGLRTQFGDVSFTIGGPGHAYKESKVTSSSSYRDPRTSVVVLDGASGLLTGTVHVVYAIVLDVKEYTVDTPRTAWCFARSWTEIHGSWFWKHRVTYHADSVCGGHLGDCVLPPTVDYFLDCADQVVMSVSARVPQCTVQDTVAIPFSATFLLQPSPANDGSLNSDLESFTFGQVGFSESFCALPNFANTGLTYGANINVTGGVKTSTLNVIQTFFNANDLTRAPKSWPQGKFRIQQAPQMPPIVSTFSRQA